MIKRSVGRPFQLGQSAIPCGRPKMPDALKACIARLASQLAIDVLEAAPKSDDEKIRIQASGMLMDRSWRKAIIPADLKVSNGDLAAEHLRALQGRMARIKSALVAGTDLDRAG